MTSRAAEHAGRRLRRVLLVLYALLSGAHAVVALAVVPNFIPVVVLSAFRVTAAGAVLTLRERFHRLLIPYLIFALAAMAVEIQLFYPFFLTFGALQSLFIMLCVTEIFVAVAVSCGTLSPAALLPCAPAAVSLWLIFEHIRGEAAVLPAATYLIAVLVGVLAAVAVRLWDQHERLVAGYHETERLNRRIAAAGARIMEQRRRENLATVTAGIAHEINNPVTYLSGNMQFLDDHVGKLLKAADDKRSVDAAALAEARQEVPEILESFRTGISTIHEVVRRLQNTFKVDRRETQVVNIRSALLAGLKAAGVTRNSALAVDVHVPDELSIVVNPADLYTIFVNVLRNAVEVMDAEGHLDIRAESTDAGVYVRIEDSGPGIAPEMRERIFDPFFSSKSTHDGMGIGLALCRLIVEQQGGDIRVAEPEKLTTCILLRFPEEPQAAAAVKAPTSGRPW